MAKNHHQSGGDGCGAADAGVYPSPASEFEAMWDPVEKWQKCNNNGTLKTSW